MQTNIIDFLACPSCSGNLVMSAESVTESNAIQLENLQCAVCGAIYPVTDGVPSFVNDQVDASTNHVSESFGYEWNLYHDDKVEKHTEQRLWGKTREEELATFFDALAIGPHDLKHKTILDAGCGSGFLTVALAEHLPQTTVVGMDLHPSILRVVNRNKSLNNLQIIRGNILNLPFKDGQFDVVWSHGVIHHTGNTKQAFTNLTRKVKPGGKLYVWVYQRKLSPLAMVRNLLTPFGLSKWNRDSLFSLCKLLSVPTWLVVQVLAPLGRLKWIMNKTHGRILTRRREYRELVMIWFDVLSPKFRDTYSTKEIDQWFSEYGFTKLVHYWYPVGVSGTLENASPTAVGLRNT